MLFKWKEKIAKCKVWSDSAVALQCTQKCDIFLSRQVSHNFHTDTNAPDVRITTMVMQFGQFLDHDMTLTPETEAECCHREGGEESRIFSKLQKCHHFFVDNFFFSI